jgi:hypothetical protein
MLKTVTFPSTRVGDQTILNGNLVIGTAGKGIDFSAAGNAPGATSEVLDDFEVGTWIPTIDQGATGITYNSQLGAYIKVGRMVFLKFAINASFTSSGAVGRIGNIPFQNSTDADGGSWLSPGQGGGSALGGISTPITPAGTFQAYFIRSGSDVVLTGGSNMVIEGTIIYMA